MKNLVILQVRTSSSRLPGKALQLINSRPMIEWQIRRIQESSIDKIVVATTNHKSDDELAFVAESLGVQVFRGSPSDVHSRYLQVLLDLNPEYFVRITGDCPLFMPSLLDEMLLEFQTHDWDYYSNTQPPTYPDGLDIEIISTKAFLAYSDTRLNDLEKEHVTLGIYSRPQEFRIKNHVSEIDMSDLRWTVDYEEDLAHVREIYSHFQDFETKFQLKDTLRLFAEGILVTKQKPQEFRNIALGDKDKHE